jgi:hypothetical protein
MRLAAHFGTWRQERRRGRNVRRWQVAAGLIYGQVKKSYRRRKLVRVTPVMRLGTEDTLKVARPRFRPLRSVEHCLYRAGQSDYPTWKSRPSSSHLGNGSADPTAARPSGMVARGLTLCASACLAASGACAAS